MKKQKHQIQQGDVVLKRLTSDVDFKAFFAKHTGKPHVISKDTCTLALGEATGHHHTLVSENSRVISLNSKKYLVVEQKAELTHQEHKPVTIEPGIYEFGQVQEWDYFGQVARTVQD